MKRLMVSFSGGETSAFMAQWLLKSGGYDEVINILANTGQELEKMLVFSNRCDAHFGLNLVWVEGVVQDGKGNGTKHRVVDFKSANRDGTASFEPMIAKYGIPNTLMKHCTRELKTRPIYDYMDTIWERGSYDIAIGIRADEIDRVDAKHKEKRIIYPLIKLGITKPMINTYWRDMPFRLGLKGYEGNCAWCWKKSKRKHITLLREAPERYNFPRAMELKYPFAGAMGEKYSEPQRFFRGKETVDDLARQAQDLSILNAEDDAMDFSLFNPDLDKPDGNCHGSCEAFSDEAMEGLNS